MAGHIKKTYLRINSVRGLCKDVFLMATLSFVAPFFVRSLRTGNENFGEVLLVEPGFFFNG